VSNGQAHACPVKFVRSAPSCKAQARGHSAMAHPHRPASLSLVPPAITRRDAGKVGTRPDTWGSCRIAGTRLLAKRLLAWEQQHERDELDSLACHVGPCHAQRRSRDDGTHDGPHTSPCSWLSKRSRTEFGLGPCSRDKMGYTAGPVFAVCQENGEEPTRSGWRQCSRIGHKLE